ncbi:hypothetical protein T261_5395 [Streptomyces lydicus]|nr:hypothetical protein T261_5395 [Streptomyces lydicus]
MAAHLAPVFGHRLVSVRAGRHVGSSPSVPFLPVVLLGTARGCFFGCVTGCFFGQMAFASASRGSSRPRRSPSPSVAQYRSPHRRRPPPSQGVSQCPHSRGYSVAVRTGRNSRYRDPYCPSCGLPCGRYEPLWKEL